MLVTKREGGVAMSKGKLMCHVCGRTFREFGNLEEGEGPSFVCADCEQDEKRKIAFLHDDEMFRHIEQSECDPYDYEGGEDVWR